ncbi:MAG: hypothetical protein M3290_03905 [Actinomycetota bacterium]|nr:hypothetical protein [Actinomycetota bacterium]
MIMRLFDTAIDPDDVEVIKELFRRDILPAFEKFEGFRGISMHLGVEEHGGDLVECVAVSSWDSMEAVRAAESTHAYADAMREIRKLFGQAPLIRHFETVEVETSVD